MPNWCYNSIKVEGTMPKVRPLFKKLTKLVCVDPKSVNYGIRKLTDISTKTGFIRPGSDVYARTMEHVFDDKFVSYKDIDSDDLLKLFGTKWDLDLDLGSLEFGEDNKISFRMAGQSPWSPPAPWCVRLSMDYGVDVECSFEESGDCFGGIISCSPDKVEEWCTNWDAYAYCFTRDEYLDTVRDSVEIELEGSSEAEDRIGEVYKEAVAEAAAQYPSNMEEYKKYAEYQWFSPAQYLKISYIHNNTKG